MIIDSHSHIGDYGGVWSKKMVDSLMPQFGRWDYWMDPSRKWRPEDFHIDPDRYVEYMDKTGIEPAVTGEDIEMVLGRNAAQLFDVSAR